MLAIASTTNAVSRIFGSNNTISCSRHGAGAARVLPASVRRGNASLAEFMRGCPLAPFAVRRDSYLGRDDLLPEIGVLLPVFRPDLLLGELFECRDIRR